MMNDTRRTCRAEKDDGTPCRSPFVQENGYCSAHNPDAPADEMRRRARKGGQATKERWEQKNAPHGLEEDELPALTSHADAKAWLEVIGRAVLTGRIDRNMADPASRAIREWISAHQGEVVDEKLAELQERLAAIEQHWSKGAGTRLRQME